jgi:PAS domain S-box-containing protein
MKPRILFVEDEALIRDHLAQAISDEFVVDTAANGEQALLSVLASRPDLIVTDIVMPTLDGVELVRLLRATPSTSTIPILLTSGVAPENARIEGFELGADSFLAKPYSERELRARLRSMLLSSRRRDEVAQQEALTRANAERAALLESITDGFFAVDEQWRFTYVNHRAVEFFGRPLGDLLGKDLWAVVQRANEIIYVSEFERSMAEQTPSTFETQFPPDHRWLEVHVFPNSRGLAINFRDISDRRSAEQERKEAERRKDEFVATLAHELRNPLAPIRTGIHVLRKRLPPSGELGPLLAMMDRQMIQMVRLVDDLLDVSRISRGQLELQRALVPVSDAVWAAVEATSTLFEERGHELKLEFGEVPLMVNGDSTRLAQVFTNLLSNSAKYTNAGGKVTISANQQDGSAVVVVKDNGIGIPNESLDHVFDLFSQVRLSQGQTESGLGIGLSVVRTLVHMHGGTIEVESAGRGHGSAFTIRLPLAAAEMRKDDVPKRTDHKSRCPLRILVVDDNQDAGQSLGMMLEGDKHSVRVAFSGQEALSAVETFQPNLILMDLGMPGMDGLEATRRIRRLETIAQPTIIAITGWGQESDRERSKAAGLDEHLVKPVDIDQLQALMAKLCFADSMPVKTIEGPVSS